MLSAVGIEESCERGTSQLQQVTKGHILHMVQGALLYETAELSKASTKLPALAERRGAGCGKCLSGLKWGFPGAGTSTSADVRNNSHWQCAQALASGNGNKLSETKNITPVSLPRRLI